VRRTQIFLTKNQHDILKAEAREEGVSLSKYIRQVIDEHLQGKRRRQTEEGILTLLKMTEELES